MHLHFCLVLRWCDAADSGSTCDFLRMDSHLFSVFNLHTCAEHPGCLSWSPGKNHLKGFKQDSDCFQGCGQDVKGAHREAEVPGDPTVGAVTTLGLQKSTFSGFRRQGTVFPGLGEGCLGELQPGRDMPEMQQERPWHLCSLAAFWMPH